MYRKQLSLYLCTLIQPRAILNTWEMSIFVSLFDCLLCARDIQSQLLSSLRGSRLVTVEQTRALEDDSSPSDPKEQAFKCEERGLRDAARKGEDAIAGRMETAKFRIATS